MIAIFWGYLALKFQAVIIHLVGSKVIGRPTLSVCWQGECASILILWKIDIGPWKRKHFLDRKGIVHHLGPTIYREGSNYWGQSRCAWKSPNSFWWFGIQDTPIRSLPWLIHATMSTQTKKNERNDSGNAKKMQNINTVAWRCIYIRN